MLKSLVKCLNLSISCYFVIYVWTNKIVSLLRDIVITGCDHYKLSYAILFSSLTTNSTEKSLASTKSLVIDKYLIDEYFEILKGSLVRFGVCNTTVKIILFVNILG